MGKKRGDRIGQTADHPVETDTRQSVARLELGTGLAHQHNRLIRCQHVTCILRVAAGQTAVVRTDQMALSELARFVPQHHHHNRYLRGSGRMAHHDDGSNLPTLATGPVITGFGELDTLPGDLNSVPSDLDSGAGSTERR